MVDIVKEALDIGLYNITIAAKLQFDGEVFDCLLCANSWPVAVADSMEVLFIDGFQQQTRRPLQQPVFYNRYT
jgi:hypothetical protein